MGCLFSKGLLRDANDVCMDITRSSEGGANAEKSRKGCRVGRQAGRLRGMVTMSRRRFLFTAV